jgi:hypothetical protein
MPQASRFFHAFDDALLGRAWEQRQVSGARQQATTAVMDAAEHLLYEVG